MPLQSGYGREVIAANVTELEKTIPRRQAVAAALAYARQSYFKRYPHGALPRVLAYPKTHPLKHHYDKHGNPLHAEAAAVLAEKNPSRRQIAQARALGRAFTGHPYNRAVKLRQKPAFGPRVAIGPVTGIMYLAKRDGRVEQYLHKFAPRSRPLLVTLSDGTRLELLGGAFRFTDRGIVDSRVAVRNRKRKG